MKPLPLFVFLVSFAPLVAQIPADAGSTVIPAAETPKPQTPAQQAFSNLPKERRDEYIKHLQEASRLFQQKRIFETLEELDKGEKIFTEDSELLNLRGSCFVEMRAFDKALASYEKARALSGENPSIDFNIAEVFFVTKEWKKSHDLFEKIMKQLPPENTALGRLVEFKVLLCKKKLGMKDEAIILAEKYDFLDDSPYYYYAQAAIAYDDGNLIKAEEWLAMAGRIFQDPNILAPWQDTLVEFGYIKSFYGEDAAASE